MKKVLIVDDEQSILTLLKYSLEKEGYEVIQAEDGQTGFDIAMKDDLDFIILDLMLPKMDGMDVCKNLRLNKVNTPILMLTAKDDELERIIGLELGADDYMTKPFSPREVLARMKAILRRASYSSSNVVVEKNDEKHEITLTKDSVGNYKDEDVEIIRAGDIEIHVNDYVVYVRGESIEMTPKEFELLTYMARRVNRTLSREQLLQKLWRFDYAGETRIVDVHVSHLREKIELDTKNPEYIITVRGFGYKFEVPN
ncbi:DNA-binding response regulator [Aerococcus agrisoli]|uniref:DNA-binding response regulator n=1 Tax=Aerococcus agrisoli TaxID=2487350 RepID=A0A3N4HFI9_9LACT|nr:response regulator transcription factor [Aerococcus agrisoli]RPA65474.1 DNA-binding response regulator [Aerococcus agrisoli]